MLHRCGFTSELVRNNANTTPYSSVFLHSVAYATDEIIKAFKASLYPKLYKNPCNFLLVQTLNPLSVFICLFSVLFLYL
nr:MAG TPA: hypothetical protein [Caudoviricetes sp.]